MPDRNQRWSDRSLEENRTLTIYLFNEWGEEIMLKVQELIHKTTIRIHNSPEQFPVFSKRKNVRRCVVSPQTSIFFRVYKNDIVIISVFDNSQRPKKRKF